ncbi:hypothetical protein TNCT_678461 [Trichonephila clavata]|uniref:Uncharacterized protein n=1 Tax=Trichonephila clavata TaxID=2740835 RepID=A0A8X6HMQ8_TRICU|nr:hypothetical protein TNCT_678461 [Trichonephila clavata]
MFTFRFEFVCSFTKGEIERVWSLSGHKENPRLDDGVEFSTLSAQERVFDGAKGDIFVSIGDGKTIFSSVVIILATDSCQFHRAPARSRIHTFLTCQVERPEDP